MLFLTALFLPLLSVLLILLSSRKIGVFGSIIVSCANLIAALLISCVMLSTAVDSWMLVDVWAWLGVSGHSLAFSLRLDASTAVMFFVVCMVSSCVHVYSSVYMYTDPYLSRFMLYLSFFTFFMLLLVSSGN